MKKITALVLAALLGSTLALSQTKDRSYDEFHGHWFIGIQGGIGQTVGETSFGNLISPAAAFSFGYQFTPVWGLRAGLSGWQAKGARSTTARRRTSGPTSRRTTSCGTAAGSSPWAASERAWA